MNQVEILKSLFSRDLERLATEIEAYREEGNLWSVLPGTTNSGGNLALHLVGNLNTYVCGELGNSGYVRDRPAEFSAKNVPRVELLALISATKHGIIAALDALPEAHLTEDYTGRVFPETMTVGWFLFHLATHLTYHLGQVNYHRRATEGQGVTS